MRSIVLIQALFVATSLSCTSIVVTPGASKEGSTIISYSADSPLLYGGVTYRAHKTHYSYETVTITDWIETDKVIGKIPQVNETYKVVGNVNEYGVAIAASVFGGLKTLQQQTKGIMEYGSLIYIALGRSKSAQSAISVMTDLIAKYGYYSPGVSYTIADSKEVWVLEVIGKGDFELGAVWVAMKVPDGHVTAHANQARIGRFPRNDPKTCKFSSDVITFAKKHGFYPSGASDDNFSFSDVYSPMSFEKARNAEARVWAFFRKVAGEAAMDQYKDYVLGVNLTNRMPWSVKVSEKIDYRMVINCTRDYYQGTFLDFTQDVGAGPFSAPYRNYPLNFEVNGKQYTHERPTAIQDSGWVMVAELRPNYPDPMKAINWFSADDSKTSVFLPLHGAISNIPAGFAVGEGSDIMHASLQSAFWLFNIVAQMTYSNWEHIYPDVAAKIKSLEDDYESKVKDIDEKAKALYLTGYSDEATSILTEFCGNLGDALVSTWYEFWLGLVPKYLDGYVKVLSGERKFPEVKGAGYNDAWYERIVKETGDKYVVH